MKDITAPLTKGKDVVVKGIVVTINLEPMAWCGNGTLTLLTTDYGELILQIIGGRRPQCPRVEVMECDSIEACGIVIEENAIALTNPEKHYLRLEPSQYDADNIKIIESDDSNYNSVDLSRSAFKRNLQDSAILARDFTRTMVVNTLPDAIVYTILYGCAYDGNPLIGDEKTFPDDYTDRPISTLSPDDVTECLWRNGFVPEWINVTVSHEDGEYTYIDLECCGRYSATANRMYHIREGRPPFHVLGPPLPPDYEREDGAKFDLYWQKDA
jgi:hypothetical protein